MLDHLDPEVKLWWVVLCVGAAFNFTALVQQIRRRLAGHSVPLLSFAVVYATACIVRSVLPRVDDKRFCFVDHPLSSPFVGRTLATFAEISFAAQLSASLRSVAPRAGDVRVLSYIITALCTVAQVFCWIGVATQQTWYSAVEESLWAVAATLMLLCASLTLLRGASVGYEWTVGCRRLLLGVLLTAPGYIAYMVLVDVPMYLARHAAHVQLNKPFYPLKEGVLDMFRCEVTGKWADWAEEPSWMTPYFVGALYVSICLADPPAPVKRAPAQKKMQ